MKVKWSICDNRQGEPLPELLVTKKSKTFGFRPRICLQEEVLISRLEYFLAIAYPEGSWIAKNAGSLSLF
jgi:hypothetical protein